MLEYLVLHYSLRLDRRDQAGNSPLHLAAVHCNPNAVNFLLRNGAEIQAVNSMGRSALHVACTKYTSAACEVVQLLLAAGSSVDQTDTKGQTPLLVQCSVFSLMREISAEIVQLLLKFGARIDVTDQSNQTALHLASAKGNTNVVKLLISHGALINLPDAHLNTPLHLAVADAVMPTRPHNIETVGVLLEAGADVHALNDQRKRPIDLCRNQKLIGLLSPLVIDNNVELRSSGKSVNVAEMNRRDSQEITDLQSNRTTSPN